MIVIFSSISKHNFIQVIESAGSEKMATVESLATNTSLLLVAGRAG